MTAIDDLNAAINVNAEAPAETNFDTLLSSNTSEIAAARKAIETNRTRSGQVAVEPVQGKGDLKSTEKAVVRISISKRTSY